MTSSIGIEKDAEQLLAAVGIKREFSLVPIEGSANNRAFRVETGGKSYFLKSYFQHPGDPRDRLGAEFSFARFAWGQGLRCLAEPLAADPALRLGLYGFIEGKQLAPEQVFESSVRQALDFYHGLNRRRDSKDAKTLPAGSEACFSLEAHLRCVDSRLTRLAGLPVQDPLYKEAGDFIREKIVPTWKNLREKTLRRARELGLDAEKELRLDERRLSPSDFGFHNCLVDSKGICRFVDFEYAGWDDPAKLACDFFCQVKVPVPMEYFEKAASEIVSDLPFPERHIDRIKALLPVYRIKWCCILLNDFLPVGDSRRAFAKPGEDADKRRDGQLKKARQALETLAT